MRRKIWMAAILVGFTGLGLISMLQSHGSAAQKTTEDAQWAYKVGVISYNPGERLTDEQRAAVYERTLNDHARQGWEPIGTILSRDTIQTVGGGVTTRDTKSFVAYRRRR